MSCCRRRHRRQEGIGLNKTRDPNSLSWMPRNVPISTGIFERGFYIKKGVVKYRHGAWRKVIHIRTFLGGMFYAILFLAISFICALPILGTELWPLIFGFFFLLSFIYSLLGSARGVTIFILKDNIVTGVQLYMKYKKNGKRSYWAGRARDMKSVFFCVIICIHVTNLGNGLRIGIDDNLAEYMFLEFFFSWEEIDAENYLDGLLSIFSRDIPIDKN